MRLNNELVYKQINTFFKENQHLQFVKSKINWIVL